MREPNFFVDAASFLFAMASGVAFPVIVLPVLLRPIAFALPTTYALDILRIHALGTTPIAPEPIEWLALVATSLIALRLGIAAFRRTEHRMRVLGTLGQH
jgi:ABC-type polysaccharide/polyol phosphate export permease